MSRGGVAVSSFGRARQPFEAGDELAVEDGDLPVQHERWELEVGHRGGQIREPAGQIAPVRADEPHAGGVLVRQHPPAVDLLLVDSAGVVEGALYFGRGHRRLDDQQGSGHPGSIRSRPSDRPCSALSSRLAWVLVHGPAKATQ